jgi:hypothetical protein
MGLRAGVVRGGAAMSDELNDLRHAWRAVEMQWGRTRELWHDGVAQDFEQHAWSRMSETVQARMSELEQLLEALDRLPRPS